MSEGGFLLVTREGKIWNAPRAHIISAGERHCSSRGDGPRVPYKYRASLINIRCKYLVTTFALNSPSTTPAINFV